MALFLMRVVVAGIAMLTLSGCLASRVLVRTVTAPHQPKRVEAKIAQPRRPEARVSVLWVGHATVLLQLDDRYVLTDPVFTRTVGEFAPRLVEPGIDPASVPTLAIAAVSHLHFDHLSFDSLTMLESKIELLVLPPHAREYLPRYDFASRELEPWHSDEHAGVRVTAVPARHVGGRYWLDKVWTKRSYVGYVFEYHGLTVYFAGDTVFDAPTYQAIQQRFGPIDVALLPICPAQPEERMQFAHMNPEQALDALAILGARFMVPIHFDTFINGDDSVGDCSLRLLSAMSQRDVFLDRVAILGIGEQRVLVRRDTP